MLLGVRTSRKSPSIHNNARAHACAIYVDKNKIWR